MLPAYANLFQFTLALWTCLKLHDMTILGFGTAISVVLFRLHFTSF